MSNIQDRIKAVSEYFIGMNVAAGDGGTFYMYVEIALPQKWTVSKNLAEQYKIEIIPNESKTGYYFFGDMSLGHDTIFDCIEENIKLNQDSEKRVNLFKQKQIELKSLFEDMTIDLAVLETLEFKMTTPKKAKLPKPSKTKEVVADATETINEPNFNTNE